MNHITFSVRAPEHVAHAIDANAEREGLSRSAYVLSWLPEAHTEPQDIKTETQQQHAVGNAR